MNAALPLVSEPGSGAVWGPPGDKSSLWRLRLWRTVGVPRGHLAPWRAACSVAFIMLNPSTADEVENDATIRRCVWYARRWGFGRLFVVNLFSYRATDPSEIFELARTDRIEAAIGPGNDEAILDVTKASTLTVAAWGAQGDIGARARDVGKMLSVAGRSLHALKLTKHGEPAHPLYLRADLTPTPWRRP